LSRQALSVLTLAVAAVLGSSGLTLSPLAPGSFEAELLEREAGPACGSRLPGGPLLAGRSDRGRQPRFLSFHRATLGFGRLVTPCHSVLSFRTLAASPPGLGDFHPRFRTTSPSAPILDHLEEQPKPQRNQYFQGSNACWSLPACGTLQQHLTVSGVGNCRVTKGGLSQERLGGITVHRLPAPSLGRTGVRCPAPARSRRGASGPAGSRLLLVQSR